MVSCSTVFNSWIKYTQSLNAFFEDVMIAPGHVIIPEYDVILSENAIS
jgi:hypothetical protein